MRAFLYYIIRAINVTSCRHRTFMTLVRGVKANFPCTRCLVPRNLQSDLNFTAEYRTQAATKTLIESLATCTKAEAEKKLKEQGLRYLTVRWLYQVVELFINYFIECILEYQKF